MITADEHIVISQAAKRFALKPPSAATLHELAQKYKVAYDRWCKIYDQIDRIRGLDEFDPKHMAWESRLYRAECKRDEAQGVLIAAARAVRLPK